MKPTCTFRYAQRTIAENQGRPCIWFPNGGMVWVLQQWWESEDSDWDKGLVSAWRDIPIEEDK